ncbi:unnamed protein product, partial [Timema podura]|nr:unnamed protein product [Timema podura]
LIHILSEVKEGFGNQINMCRDRGLNPGPPAQKSDTLPLDHQVTLPSSCLCSDWRPTSLESKITPEFLDLTTTVMAETLGRDKESLFQYCMAEVIPDVLLSWKGSTAPAGNAMLMSIGLMGPEDNQRHAAALSEHVFKHLGIPKDRLLIEFNDVKDSDVGFNGMTVDALGLFKK